MARNAVRLRSIGAKIFFAFAAVCLFLALYGVWSVAAIDEASRIVKDTYDRPLQAINYARSANATFYRARILRLEEGKYADSERSEALTEQIELFYEDLAVAEERSLSEESRRQIVDIRDAFQRWLEAPPLPEVFGALEPALEDARAVEITEKFDLLAETMATDSFFEREKAVEQVDRSYRFGVASVVASLFAAAILTMVLARTIVRPLSIAALAADKISLGDFRADIPQGGGDETGALLRSMRVMQENINEMMAREERRRQSAEARMVDALESSNAAVVLLDQEASVIYANSKIVEFFPVIAESVEAGEGLYRALESAELSFINSGEQGQSLIAGLENGDEIQISGGKWVSVARSPMRDDGVVMILSDISDLKEREASLKIATAHAEAANRAKTRFLSNISHELKTPLHSIIGFSEIIHSESFGPLGSDQYRDYAGYVIAGGKRLLELIMDVLDIAKQEDGRLECEMAPVNVARLVAASVQQSKEASEKAGVSILTGVKDDDAWVWGDQARLLRVVNNIVSNAIKFSQKGSETRIEAGVSGSFVTIRVRDHGIGMKPEEIPLALSAFDQVDGALARKFEGAGVGLPFAKAVVDQHGGRLEIKSVPGKGTLVSIFLLSAADAAAGSLAIPVTKALEPAASA